jgi:hypothetical protein
MMTENGLARAGQIVFSTRENALDLSKDVANGLLDLINLFIEESRKTSSHGSTLIEVADALRTVKSRHPAPLPTN